jgi:hypothetical protein
MLDEMALEQAFFSFFSLPLLIIIPSLLHIDVYPPSEMCNSPDQATYNLILSL